MLSTLLYYFILCYGLGPFKFNYSNTVPRVHESNSVTFLNLIVGSIVCIVTALIQTSTLLTWIPDRPKFVSLVVATMEACSLIVQNFAIFFIQFANRKVLIRFINAGFDLTAELKILCPQEKIFSVRFRKYLRWKCVAKIVQITWLTTTTLLFVVSENHIADWMFGFACVLIYLYPTVITSLYYCGSVLLSFRFCEIINSKITQILTEHLKKDNNANTCLQLQLFCDVSDEFDYVANLYDRIASFVELISERFSVQILFIQLTSFLLTISTVKNIIITP